MTAPIQPGDAVWAVHYNLLQPTYGMALAELPKTKKPEKSDKPNEPDDKNKNNSQDELTAFGGNKKPKVKPKDPDGPGPIKGFAPFLPGTEKPDMGTIMKARLNPDPRSRCTARLYRTKNEAIREWNRRVDLEVESENIRHRQRLDFIMANYLDEDPDGA